jgi:hypothetical protein
MNTSQWGPGAWVSFHAMCFNFPKEPTYKDRSRYKRYYHLLGEMLPCRYCRESYVRFLEEIPMEPYLKDREGMIYWAYRIHDRVNQKLDKKSCDFVEYVRTYENMRAKCAKREVISGGLVGGCVEPIKDFGSDQDVEQYARSIWDRYHPKGKGAPMMSTNELITATPPNVSVIALSVAAIAWIGAAAMLG